MDSLSTSSTKMKKNKLSVRNQPRFKKPFLLAREKTILKKALELSILCDNQICVIHYDRDGNLINTLPEDQRQVKDIVEKYTNLSDGEKLKKNTNLSQFFNKKLLDEKKRSLTDAQERKRFTKKVGDFKSSLEDQFHILQDMLRDHLLYSQDHQSPFLDVTSQENHNFPEASSYGFSCSLALEDPLMNFSPHDLDQQQSFSDLVMSGDHVSTRITDQYLLSPASSAATVCSFNHHHQRKFSVFLFNHETTTFTQLPNSASSSFEQGLIGTY